MAVALDGRGWSRFRVATLASMMLGDRLAFRWRWRMWHPLQRTGFLLGAPALIAGVILVALGHGFTGILAIILLPILGIAIAHAGHRRLARHLRRGALPCPRCRYDLRGLAPEGACPECAEPYHADDLREAWRICMITIV